MAAAQRIRHTVPGESTTTDAATVTTVVATATIPDASVVSFTVDYLGRAESGAVAHATLTGSAKRVSGTLSIVGTPVPLLTFANGSDAALATCAATIDANSNTIRARIQGIALTTIDWFATIQSVVN